MFGKILKIHRETHSMTQAELAEELGISRPYLSRIERGYANNLSFDLGVRILNLAKPHAQIEVVLQRRVYIDALIAPEIIWLNSQGVITEACCQGPPASALIRPSSRIRAEELGYYPRPHGDLFEIWLKTQSVER
jgi:transcriptional regulator with XRE-family HTH domain